MSSLTSFLEMGGYGGFVWPAYALSAVVLLALLFDALRRLRNDRRALARLEAEAPRRRGSRGADPLPGSQGR
jgi:heme exporter protein D